MRASTLRTLLIAPVFLYVVVVNGHRFAGWSLAVVVLVDLMAVPFLELVDEGFRGVLFLPAWALAMVLGVVLVWGNGLPTGPWAVVSAAVLLGAPLTMLAGLVAWRESPTRTLVGCVACLGALLALLKGGAAASALSESPGPTAWIAGFGQVALDQASALQQWVGSGGVPPATPLGGVWDLGFVALAIIAGFGVVLGFLERPAASGAGPEPTEPLFPRSAGVAPLVIAVVAGLAFEAAAAFEPRYALLGVALGVVATLVGLLVISGREGVRSPEWAGGGLTGSLRASPGSSRRERTTDLSVAASARGSGSPGR